MNDITIVTAFFDIGRGDWTPSKGLPHYLQRTTDTYFDRFANMAKLDNTIVVYTSEDLAEKVWELRKGKESETVVVVVDFEKEFDEYRDSIRKIQNNPDLFETKILTMHKTKEQALKKEEYIQKHFSVHTNELYINQQISGKNFTFPKGTKLTEEHKRKIGEANSKSLKGKKYSEQVLRNQLQIL